MITTHYFTAQGFRTMPIGKMGYELRRNKDTLQKYIVDAKGMEVANNLALPPNWTEAYGHMRVQHTDTPLGGLICGVLTDLQPGEIEVIALDCDDDNTWTVFNALNPCYTYKFKSIGKAGGTILYKLPDELRAVYQFSIKSKDFKLDYMTKREQGANAMIYLPTSANKTKEALDSGATISYPPESIIALVKSLAPARIENHPTEVISGRLPYNAPLVKQYVDEVRAKASDNQMFGKLDKVTETAKKVYQIFTPKEFRKVMAYEAKGWVHPNNDELVPYSKYITGLSAIAGADPSIDPDLYLTFMQAINSQIDAPYPGKRYIAEVLSPMLEGKAKIGGIPIWKYDEEWDKKSLTVINQYGENLEYFIDEISPNTYLEYNHVTNSLLRIKNLKNLIERIYSVDNKASDELPSKTVVKRMRLLQEIKTVRQDPGLYIDTTGKMVINIEKASPQLQILKNPDIFPEDVDDTNLYAQAFDVFLAHLTNNDQESALFLKQVIAYHGYNLEAIPIIIYIVGVGGAGKSEFAFMLEKLFGSNVTRRPQPKHLTSQWNDFLENCAILVLSETGDASRRDQEGIKSILKQVTGERTMDIQAKFQPLRNNVPMFVLPVLLTNTPWYQEDVKDRRLFPIVPLTSIAESKVVLDFEKEHGIRLTEFIHEGIEKGIIPKWLSSFRPKQLPPVPRGTQAVMQVADTESDPIAKVKRLVIAEQWYELVCLMEEYNVGGFFEVMNHTSASFNKGRVKEFVYRQHLVDLVKNMREGSIYPLDSVISRAFTSNGWLELATKVQANTNGTGITSYKVVGRYKWPATTLAEAFEQWSIDSLKEGSDD